MSHRLKHLLTGTLVSGVFLLASGAAHATAYRWIGPDAAAWNNAANWSPQGIPTAGDNVIIDGKKKVSVPTDATVANLIVGAGTEIRNSGKLKVTGRTASAGLFTGAGSLNVPVGATAELNVDTSNTLAATTGSTTPTIVFAPITNSGRITAKVSPGCRVDFADLQNSGSIDVVSDGTVTFKNIKNTKDLNVNVSGTLTLARVENTTGASLSIAAPDSPVTNSTMTPFDTRGRITRSRGDQVDPSVVHLDEIINRSKGKFKLTGVQNGRMFDGKSIQNQGDMEICGAQTLLEADVTNSVGATLTLNSDARIFPSDLSAPKLNNAGKLVKSAGSDATLNVEWNNMGEVVVENGTLHVQVPAGKACKQISGTTTLEGGTMSIEDALGTTSSGTYEVAGGTLDGIGTIEGNLKNSGGHLKPGHSPGSITINGNYVQTAGGVLDMELGGTTPGVSYDQILVSGTAYLDGSLNIIRWGNYVPAQADIYVLFTYYARVGNFAQVLDALPLAGLTYDTTLTPTTFELNTYVSGPIDSSPPTATINAPLNNGAAPSITGATGTASDAVGLSQVTCRLYRYTNPVTGVPAGFWDGATWTAAATSANERLATGTTSWSFTFPSLVPGRYSLRATAKDTSGNSASSATVAFYVDPNAPSVVTISAPLAGANLTSIGTISGTASDASDGSGIIVVKGQLRRNSDGLYWNGTAWAAPYYSFTLTLSGINWSRSTGFPTGANLLPGSYSIIITATDKAGNTKAVGNNFNIIPIGGDARTPVRGIVRPSANVG